MRRAYPSLTVILLLGCIALGCLVLRQKTEIIQVDLHRGDADRAAREEGAALQHKLAAANEAQGRAEKLAAQAKPIGAAASQPVDDRTSEVLHLHVSDIVKEHPEFAAIWAAQQRRDALQQYGSLLAALNLPPDQLAKLKDLLVERNQSEEDARQAARVAGLNPGTPAFRQAVQNADAEVEQQMAALVGGDGHQFAQQLQNESSAQSQIRNTYGPDFDDAGVSLTAEQSRTLTEAIANANYAGKSTADRSADYNIVDPDTNLTPHDNRIITAAAAAMTPSQVEVLRTDLMQVHQQQAILQQYRINGPVKFVP